MNTNGDNKPNTLKEAIKAKYDSLIENETCELTVILENQQVIIGWLYFKLEKDQEIQNFKFKAK